MAIYGAFQVGPFQTDYQQVTSGTVPFYGGGNTLGYFTACNIIGYFN